ncbi:bifunctional solanapyrone synthase [Triangularia verruculosa]|uniref:Bifunctional solanapyrone synthase n=1 Tax=Triangularia verruculosa TaxID=2587418 RepID=A0AAN7AS63_9PEZI|nr:bifunctional solanapyrone synthase [Triangularia verruculosa]
MLLPLFRTLCVICLLVIFHAHKAAAAAANLNSICSTLASRLPNNRVALPRNEAYNVSTSSYAYANQQTQRPSCIVQPASATEVSLVIKLLRQSPNTPFAVRSGGHATNRGFSNIDGSVTIDLTALRAVRVLKDGVTVSIDTGASWGDVYRVLDPRRRSLNGGRASNVGIGGFLSGGGIGFFALKYGFGCDAVTNVQVVLANGDIIEANNKSHKDLFVALKGGQNNFGIVTRWDVTTVPQGNVWGGSVVYLNTTTAAQLNAFTRWKSSKNFDPASSVEQSHVYIGSINQWLVASLLFYSEPTPFPKDLKGFTDIQPQLDSSLRITNVSGMADEIQSQSTPNQYTIFSTLTIAISPTILRKIHSLWVSSVQKQSANNIAITSSLTLQSIPSPPSSPSRQNSLGFPSASTPQKDLVLVLLSSFWEDPAHGPQVEAAVQWFITEAEKTARREGVYHKFQYPNYAAAQFQDPLRSTGRLEELRKVAKRYDPTGVFQRQVRGGWKLF